MAIIHRTNAFMYYAHLDFVHSTHYFLEQVYDKPSQAKIDSFAELCILMHDYHANNPSVFKLFYEPTAIKIIRYNSQAYTAAFEIYSHNENHIFVVVTKDNVYWCTFDELAKYYNF